MSESWDPMNCSLPGFSVHRILQARILEWVAISFSNSGICISLFLSIMYNTVSLFFSFRAFCWFSVMVDEDFAATYNHPSVLIILQFNSVTQLCPPLRPREPQHARPPCSSPIPGVYPHSRPLSQWCHLTISSSVIPFSSCPQSFPASGSFQMSQPFTSGVQSIGVSASTSVLPMSTQDWSPLGWTG